jgi:hypothetical protein
MKRSLTTLAALLLAAPGAWAAEEQPTVEKCDREMGSLAVAEPQDYVLASLGRYHLGSPSTMLRMIAQESGCFAVVERGVAMQNMQQERALASGGQLQGGSNIGGGQMQAADFVMTPAVQFSADTGGVGGAVSGLLGRAGGVLGQIGGLAGGVQFKEAETTLLVADVRSGIQVASAEGKASKMNFALGGWGWGGLGWASGGGFNRIVAQIRNKPQLIRSTSVAAQQNAANSIQATGGGAAAAKPVVQTTQVAQSGGALPAMMVGAFSGQYSGADSGVFSVLVAADGRISGVGQSSSGQSLSITGTANASGSMVMSGTGQAGGAQFTGLIDQGSGSVIGTWRQANGKGQGTFNGRKQ